MKKIPETKARMVRWGRMWPMLLSTKPMNMKKRLTRGKGVAERIISGRRQELISIFVTESETWNFTEFDLGCSNYTVHVTTLFVFVSCCCLCMSFSDFLKLLMEVVPLSVATWGFPLRLLLLIDSAFQGSRTWLLIYIKMALDLPPVSTCYSTSQK